MSRSLMFSAITQFIWRPSPSQGVHRHICASGRVRSSNLRRLRAKAGGTDHLNGAIRCGVSEAFGIPPIRLRFLHAFKNVWHDPPSPSTFGHRVGRFPGFAVVSATVAPSKPQRRPSGKYIRSAALVSLRGPEIPGVCTTSSKVQ
jgi:hypothetical protein